MGGRVCATSSFRVDVLLTSNSASTRDERLLLKLMLHHLLFPVYLFLLLLVLFSKRFTKPKKAKRKDMGAEGGWTWKKKQEKLFSYLNCGLLADVIRERKLRFKWGGIFFLKRLIGQQTESGVFVQRLRDSAYGSVPSGSQARWA